MKRLFTFILTISSAFAFSQSVTSGIPDSVQNINYPGSTGQYNISNPLVHNGTSFTNPPISFNCIMNCIFDYLYFYDLNLNVPSAATITGVEVIHTRGGCNSGSFVIDTLHLAYNSTLISSYKRDSASGSTTDTAGASSDIWSAALTPAIVNDNNFGLFINSTSTGICTFGQFDIRVNVYYNLPNGISTITTGTNLFEIYPNPAGNILKIKFNGEIKNGYVSIYNLFENKISGEFIYSSSDPTEINLENISAGIYILKITDGENSFCKKLIINHN
jgi:hypothetical protein